MSGIESDCLFVIIPELYNPEKGYALATIWPNVIGIVETSFHCGHDLDLAIEFARELNCQRNHDTDFVTRMLEIQSGLANITFYET